MKYILRKYIADTTKEDYEIVEHFKKSVPEPNKTVAGISNLRDGTIFNDPWAIVYKSLHQGKYENMIFYLNEKHCYKSTNLNEIVARMEMNPMNQIVHKKHIRDTLTGGFWFITF